MVVDHEIIASQMSLAERIHMATLCHDTDMIPKVPGAGSIQVEPNGMRVQLMHNGLRVIADGYCGSWMTELIRLCRGHHEPQEERVFYEIVARLENDATMIELGAYWAFYSLWFLQGQPRRVAILLEPDPLHRAAGETNAKLNNISLQILSGFIGSSPAVAVPFHTDSGEDLLIPRVTVPQLMEENGIAKLDILHCDTQGAELDVLESCADMLRSGRIRVIIISTHHFLISGDPLTHQRCLNRVRSYGGYIIAEHDVHESYSGDGLIVAAFGEKAKEFPTVTLSHNRYSNSLFRNPLYDLAESQKT